MYIRGGQPVARWVLAGLQDACGSNISVVDSNLYRHTTVALSQNVLFSQLAHGFVCSRARSSSTLADVRRVEDLAIRNDELAEAVSRDRAMARRRLYDKIMPCLQSESASERMPLAHRQPPSAVHVSQLSKVTVCPCVTAPANAILWIRWLCVRWTMQHTLVATRE